MRVLGFIYRIVCAAETEISMTVLQSDWLITKDCYNVYTMYTGTTRSAAFVSRVTPSMDKLVEYDFHVSSELNSRELYK